MKLDVIYNEDCLKRMNRLPNESINLVLTDPPYGITACDWDKVPDLEKLWTELKRIGRNNCAYIFTTSQPFTTDLINSNRKWFKYDWVYKKRGVGHLLSKKRPLQGHESILIFYQRQPIYNPQKIKRTPQELSRVISAQKFMDGRKVNTERKLNIKRVRNKDYLSKYPTTFIDFIKSQQAQQYVHPTQKPVALMEYMIKTYSNKEDLILDPFLGSGTTAIAARMLGRHYIGFEINPDYCEIAKNRLKNIQPKEK